MIPHPPTRRIIVGTGWTRKEYSMKTTFIFRTARERRAREAPPAPRRSRTARPGAWHALLALCAAACLPSVATGQQRSGAEIYEAVCAECHTTGKHKAPVIGDRKAWKPLIAEGQPDLVRTAIRGVRKMPARGGDPSLSDAEVERAVVHMTNASGGRFKSRD